MSNHTFNFLSLPRELRDQIYAYLLLPPITGVKIAVLPQRQAGQSSSLSADAAPRKATLYKAIYTFDPFVAGPPTAIFLTCRQLNLEAWQTLAREGVAQTSTLGREPLRLSYLDTCRLGMEEIAREIREVRALVTEVTSGDGRRISLFSTKESPWESSRKSLEEYSEMKTSGMLSLLRLVWKGNA